METEREQRESEILVTIDDYKNLLDVFIECSRVNNQYIKQGIESISYGMLLKAQYIIDISAPERKKQGWFSRWLDRRRENKRLKAQEMKQQIQEQDAIIAEMKKKLEDGGLLTGTEEAKALEIKVHGKKNKANLALLSQAVECYQEKITRQQMEIKRLEKDDNSFIAPPEAEVVDEVEDPDVTVEDCDSAQLNSDGVLKF